MSLANVTSIDLGTNNTTNIECCDDDPTSWGWGTGQKRIY